MRVAVLLPTRLEGVLKVLLEIVELGAVFFLSQRAILAGFIVEVARLARASNSAKSVILVMLV